MNPSAQSKNSKLRVSARVVVFCCFFTAAGNALGQTFWVGTPSVFGNWSTASNWSLGVPDSSSGTTFDAVIANNGGAQLSVAGASVRRLRVGRQEGPGQLFVDGGGGLTVTENLHINENGTGLGAMLVDNGGIVTSQTTVVGYSSMGPSFLQITGAGSKINATNSTWSEHARLGLTIRKRTGKSLSDAKRPTICNTRMRMACTPTFMPTGTRLSPTWPNPAFLPKWPKRWLGTVTST